jgi:hypothetical protein
MPSDPNFEQRIVGVLNRQPGYKLNSFSEVLKGRNSRAFKVNTNQATLFLKFYYPRTDHRRGMEKNEFNAYTMLQQSGLHSIPKAVFYDAVENAAAMEWIDGVEPEVNEANQKQFVSLIANLRKISASNQNYSALAAEACFTLAELRNNINGRLELLKAVPNVTQTQKAMQEFINAVSKDLHKCVFPKDGPFFDSPLPTNKRLLSPSDLGFHNAIQSPSGLYFVDFDYFGWEEPGKTLSEFLLHPTMNLPLPLQKNWFQGFAEIFADDKDLFTRLPDLYQLYAIKWSLILLNEFRRDQNQRREFANDKSTDPENILETQLLKSQTLLRKAKELHGSFPTNLLR